MKTKDSRFPFQLAIVDAIFLVRHLPSLAALSLKERWQDDIFHKDNLEVDQVMYGCMRKESVNNVVATQALDKIFGKDLPKPNYKKGDLLFVRQGVNFIWEVRYFSHFDSLGNVACSTAQKKYSDLGYVYWKYHAKCGGKLPN